MPEAHFLHVTMNKSWTGLNQNKHVDITRSHDDNWVPLFDVQLLMVSSLESEQMKSLSQKGPLCGKVVLFVVTYELNLSRKITNYVCIVYLYMNLFLELWSNRENKGKIET